MSSSFVTTHGRSLAYKRFGSGPLVVCRCGGPGFPGATLGDRGGLSGERELVILDPRGAGAADRPAGDDGYRLEDYVADLDELRRHLDVDEIDLLGHSHGDFVAMTYAASHPEHVRRLVLGDIRAPTLVVTGDHDYCGPLAADDTVAGILDSRRVVLEDAGHFRSVDAPEQFRHEVGRFLAA
jgi:pimeloyl-ACP methyl ester carboxylesterase